MKNAIAFLTTFFILSFLSAQPISQKGMTRELNSDRQPISGVFIKFEDAPSTNSDANGLFALTFKGKKAGDVIFLEDIKKRGYELVNRKDFEVTKITNTDQLGADIILAKAGVVDAAKKEYYDVSDKALLAGFEKEKNNLKEKLKKAEVGQKAYFDQLTALQEQFDRQKNSLDALAEKFARVNFDDVAPIYEEALLLFKAGKVDEAIAKLESTHPTQRTAEIIQEEKRLTDAQIDLDAQKTELAAEKKKQISAVRLLADMYNVNFDPEKAETQYDQLLLLDSTNLEILQEAADFYREQHRYDKAKQTYPKIIAHETAESWQIANAYIHLGELHTATGSLPAALVAYSRCFASYHKLHSEKPSFSFYKNNLAISYSKLGETHIALGDLEEALILFQESSRLEKELYQAYPQNVEFKRGLAISYERLASTHTTLGDLENALILYQECTQLQKELYEAYPQNLEFKNNLAVSYERLGETHTAIKNLDTAFTFFEEYTQLEKELYEAYPQNVKFKNNLAISYSKLGETHTALGNLDTALTFFEESFRLGKELYEAYSQNVSFKNLLSVSYSRLGETHTALGNLDTALTFFEEYTRLEKELYEAYPQNIEFKNNLAISYKRLGNTHTALRNLDAALTFFEDGTKLFEELFKAFPQNVEFKYRLAISYSRLGETHTALGNLDTALTFFEDGTKLFEELFKAFPQNVEFKYGLAISYLKLAGIYLESDLPRAIKYLQVSESHFSELHDLSPQNAQAKRYLEIARKTLGILGIDPIKK